MITLHEWLGAPYATLLVVAHPDDESAGAGAQLGRLAELTLALVTDGAPRDLAFANKAGCATREDYAALRARELDTALRRGDTQPARVSYGLVDQEAALHLPQLIAQLTELIARVKPAAIITHAYEGGHPDHDAVAFAVAVARERSAVQAALFEMAGYNARGDGAFLPGGPPDVVVPLSGPARARKQAMLAAHASQAHVLCRFPVDSERFRLAPRYDFTQPPHAGPLYYEKHGWLVNGARFRELCAAALVEH
jgi:LmbE family N-acetylglucosaminyl deacetylase